MSVITPNAKVIKLNLNQKPESNWNLYHSVKVISSLNYSGPTPYTKAYLYSIWHTTEVANLQEAKILLNGKIGTWGVEKSMTNYCHQIPTQKHWITKDDSSAIM